MTNLMNIAKSQSLKMAPFFNSILFYFVFVKNPNGELWTTLMKCAPIVCLILYVLMKEKDSPSNTAYSKRILFGLIFSCVGDALLSVNLFPHGMGFFALAQICYTSAFGWYPLKTSIGAPLYLSGFAVIVLIFQSLDKILKFGLPIYSALLLTMCWRSTARAMHQQNFLAILCAVGSAVFVISDCLIAIDMFYQAIPRARIYIMTTYYFAQFAITLSTANENKILKSS